MKYHFTDTGRAERFADLVRGSVAFVVERKLWFTLENGVWTPDHGGLKVLFKTKVVAEAIRTDIEAQAEHAKATGHGFPCLALMDEPEKVSTAAARKRIMALAKSEPGMSVPSMTALLDLQKCGAE